MPVQHSDGTVSYTHIEAIYTHDKSRLRAVYGLLQSGRRLFSKVDRVVRWSYFRQFLQMTQEKQLNDWSGQDHELMKSFGENQLTDAILVTAAIENILKARLLDVGYVVHEIKGNKKHIPVRISELTGQKSWQGSIQPTTLRLSRLIEGQYRHILALQNQLANTISKFGSYRNSLHYLPENASSFSPTDESELRTIGNFVDSSVIGRTDEIEKELGFRNRPLTPFHL